MGLGWHRRRAPRCHFGRHTLQSASSTAKNRLSATQQRTIGPDTQKRSQPHSDRLLGQGAAGAADGHERAKDFLTAAELAALLEATKAGRHGTRDHLLLLMMFRHGLRVREAVSLRLDELDLDRSMLWVHRLKGGLSVQQPIAGDELRAIRRYLALRQGDLPWLFLSERGQPLTRQAVSYLVGLAAQRAGLPGVHPHTLRHSCGYYLTNKGHDLRLIQDYLGHRDPKHTVHYTRTAGRRFDGLWR